ncbi:MAG: CbtA family protein [Rhodoplanes sp.]
MFRRIFVAALAAGAGIGLLLAALQQVALVPLILKAENYEHVDPAQKAAALPAAVTLSEVLPALIAPAHAHEQHPAATAAEGGSASRTALTIAATTLVSIGFAFLLVGAFAVSGRAVDAREGLLWGIAGFAVFALAPAFGLAPMLPGSAEADLVERQIWWVGTAAATAGGIALAVFGRWAWAVPVGIALIAAPQVIGAPHAEGVGSVPPELAASFAARSLAVAAVFWVLLGWAAGALYARLGRTEEA